MHKRITFRGMDHSPVIEEHCNGQLVKLEKFIKNERDPIYLDLILEAERTHHHHRVELRIKTPRYDLISNYEGPDMYDVIDRVIDVMYHKIHEKKRELQDKDKTADHYKGT